MKPSGHLTRSVPLQRRTRLVGKPETTRAWQDRSQQAAIIRSRIPTPRTPDETPARKRPSRAGESRARKLVYARSGGWCEIGLPGLCTRKATEWHHRKLKGQGGRWCAGNGLHGCSRCHRAVTNTDGSRPEYEQYGWLVPAWVKRPAAVKVHRWDHTTQVRAWVLLGVKGGCTPVGEVGTGC